MITGGIVFVLGLIFGSFLNALEYRIETRKPLTGRSFCPKCKNKIHWHHNIPILSYLILRGRCNDCHKAISPQYPVVEFLTGIAFLLASIVTGFNSSLNGFLVGNSSTVPWLDLSQFLALSTAYFLLILTALHDAKTKYVLTYYAYAAALFALLYNLLHFSEVWSLTNIYYFLQPFVLSALIPAFIFWLISKLTQEKAMGSGDADIAITIGLLLGWPLVVTSYYFAFIVGAVWGVGLLIKKKAGLKSELPLGPFLISGVFFAFIYGEQIIDWYAKIFLGY